jgi:hypothetical protein
LTPWVCAFSPVKRDTTAGFVQDACATAASKTVASRANASTCGDVGFG